MRNIILMIFFQKKHNFFVRYSKINYYLCTRMVIQKYTHWLEVELKRESGANPELSPQL